MRRLHCARTMTLRELMGNGAPEVEISGLAYSSQSVTAGDALFLRARVPRRRPRLRARRGRARRGGAGLRAPARARRARGRGARRARRDGAGRGALPRRPDAPSCDVVGITGTNGKTTTAFLVRAPARGGRASDRAARHREAVVGGARGGGRAHHARGDRPPGHLPRACSTRATAPARWRSPRTRSSCGRAAGIRFACRVFTNLTQDHLDFHATMEDYFAAKRRLFDGPGPPRW